MAQVQMKTKLVFLTTLLFIIGIVLIRSSLSRKEGLVETLYIKGAPVVTKTIKWTGLDSKHKLPAELTHKNFSIHWEGFLYLPRPQILRIAGLCNSRCEIRLDGNLVYKSSGKTNYPVPEWGSKSNILLAPGNAWDRRLATRTTTDELRKGGEWLRIKLKSPETLLGITLDTTGSPLDFSRTLEIKISRWKRFFKYLKGTFDINKNIIEDFFFAPVKARYIKLINRDEFAKWWSIHELYVYTVSDVFRDIPSHRLESGNHSIQIKFQSTPKLTADIRNGGRALCKIFIKNSCVLPLNKIRIYNSRVTYTTNLINEYFWILIAIPAIIATCFLYRLKTKYSPFYFVGILMFFFFLYLYSLTPNQNIFTQDGNMFYTDNTETAYMTENLKGSYQGKEWNDAKQHLLFPLLIWPFYKFGEIIFNWIKAGNNNLKVVFPIACLGALNIMLAFSTLKITLKKNLLSVGFSILYGIFFGIWFYSSFPETYIMTIVFINLFLLIILKYTDRIHQVSFLAILAFINAAATLVSLHLICLAIIPIFFLILGRRKLFLAKSILYILIILFVVIVAYQTAGRINEEFKFIQIIKYIKEYQMVWGTSTFLSLINLKAILNTILNFFFYSIGIIYVPPWSTSKLSYIGTYFNATWGTVFLFSYITFIVVSLTGLRRSGFIKRKWAQILIIWILFNTGYFLYFNPMEAFLYAPFINLPWLVILAAGYNGSSFKYKRLILGIFIISLFLNNLQYISLLRNIILY